MFYASEEPEKWWLWWVTRGVSEVARVEGLEPPTFAFGERCAANCATPVNYTSRALLIQPAHPVRLTLYGIYRHAVNRIMPRKCSDLRESKNRRGAACRAQVVIDG